MAQASRRHETLPHRHGGGPADFAFVPHKAPRLEEHFTGSMFFIAIDDRSFGSLGASMQDVYDTVARLNPWMVR